MCTFATRIGKEYRVHCNDNDILIKHTSINKKTDMKKNSFKWMAVSLAAIVSLGFTSCSSNDDKDDPTDPDTPINPIEPSKEDAMSPTAQKERLEATALEFMDKMPSSDFRDIVELGKYIGETYGDDYDWDNVEDWVEDAFDAAREATGTKATETKTEKWDYYTYKYNYIYTNYRSLVTASNFTGHFTAHNGRWVLEEANDLQFIFTDKRGQQCVLKVETDGSVKEAYAFNMYDRKDSDYESKDNTSTYNKYYDRTQCIIGVPEKIVVTLTQGGSQVVKTTVNIDLGSISNEEFDISKNSLTASALIELNNGYKFNVSKVAYTANTNAAVSFIMSKNGTSLVTIGVSADVNDIPSVNVSAFSSKIFDADDYNFDKINGKNAYVKLDILGKVQIQGTLSDVRKYVDYLEDAANNNKDEKNFKSYINQANALTDINLFYDGENVKQATVKLEPFAEEDWNGRTYWVVEPVINFYDGSSYSTFEAFFNEKDFKKTIDTFKSLANKYADLVDERIYW